MQIEKIEKRVIRQLKKLHNEDSDLEKHTVY